MLKNILLIAGSLLFTLLLAEIILRIIDYSYHTGYMADVCCGASLLPHAEGWQRNEGEAYIKINSKGLRDREHELQKPPDVIRIAVLGDSYAEAAQVPIAKAFWAVLEKQLSHCRGLEQRKIEVINFGVSGYGTAQELQTLRYKVWQYAPDIVLLAFLTGNDLVNNSRDLEVDKMRPFFYIREGELVLDDSFLNNPAYLMQFSLKAMLRNLLVKYSRLFHLREELRAKIQGRDVASKKNAEKKHFEPGLNDKIYSDPSDEQWKAAWAVTERLLLQIDHEVREHNAAFLLVILSNAIQVHPDPEYRNEYVKMLGVSDLAYPDRRIKNFAAKNNLPALSLMPPLQNWAVQNTRCVHGFTNNSPCSGHWNELGHELAGKLIATKICSDILSKQSML